MIDLEPYELAEVQRLLAHHLPGCEVRAFGSRLQGVARRYSDLDLAVVGRERLDWRTLEALKDAFSESDLRFRVDVVDWHAISPEFQHIIDRGYEVIQQAPAGGR